MGKNISVTLFGESHGKGVGALITGMPPHVPVDEAAIERALARRRPQGDYATPRREPDPWDILSGTYMGKTTGDPIAIWIPNKDVKSEDYDNMPYRPGHGDYTAHVKSFGADDPRGGGYRSGRLTAPLVVAGALANSLLEKQNISITSKITEIGGETDPMMQKKALEQAKKEGDSLGGMVHITIAGVPAGMGGPREASAQSALAHALYAVGAVKSVAFGVGEEAARLKGSENNDPYIEEKGNIHTETNNAGGTLSGITTGDAIEITVAVKPTPSISKPQHTVDREGKNTALEIAGRHDTAIVGRIPVVLESAAALTILDLWMERQKEIALREKTGERI
ncbi:chorismate synthase [Aedoeadaptatus urinae]|uniref:chorismate synthase n=1 Tax=Aedoeadaptatus urinae TaxID=1871017 RepID=UPI00097D9602|nr:chorismate synthase [Peptoniphilus urinae]